MEKVGLMSGWMIRRGEGFEVWNGGFYSIGMAFLGQI